MGTGFRYYRDLAGISVARMPLESRGFHSTPGSKSW